MNPKIWTAVSAGTPGKTSFITNLAVLCARKFSDKKVVLVDFNFLRPDVANILNICDYFKGDFPRSLDDLYPLLFGRQTIVLNDYLTRPFANLSNFYVLPGFIQHTNCESNLAREHWAHLLDTLSLFADYLLFDTDQNIYHPGFQYLIGASDLYLLTIEQDPLSLVHNRYLINNFAERGRAEDIRTVLLRYVDTHPLGVSKIYDFLNRAVDFSLPNIERKLYERQIYDSRLLALEDNHLFTKALTDLLNSISNMTSNEVVVSKESKSGKLARFFRRRK